MTKADLDHFQQTLTTLRIRLKNDVTGLSKEALNSSGGDGSGGNSTATQHPGDLGTDNFEMEFTLGLIQNQENVLTEIDEALERIHLGAFGKCEECSSVIPKGRLEALPYARYCVACARKLQQ